MLHVSFQSSHKTHTDSGKIQADVWRIFRVVVIRFLIERLLILWAGNDQVYGFIIRFEILYGSLVFIDSAGCFAFLRQSFKWRFELNHSEAPSRFQDQLNFIGFVNSFQLSAFWLSILLCGFSFRNEPAPRIIRYSSKLVYPISFVWDCFWVYKWCRTIKKISFIACFRKWMSGDSLWCVPDSFHVWMESIDWTC